MKLLIQSILLFVAFFSTFVARGAAFGGFSTAFGSMSNAIANYGVPNSRILSVSVYQNTPEGSVRVRNPSTSSVNFASKEELDTFFRQKLILVAEGALTNSVTDKDKPFMIFGKTSRVSPELGFLNYFYLSTEFSLVKSEDGSYHLPDFSGLQLQLVESVIFEIPGLKWARVEGRNNPATNPNNLFEEVDSRINPEGAYPPFDISTSLGYIQIDSGYATSGTNGATLIKISTVTQEGTNYVFRVYGPMGNQIPETPIITTNFKVEGGETTFDIEGGDPGRVLMVQCAPSPSGPWEDTGESVVVPRYGSPIHIRRMCEGPISFFRIRTVNTIPFWQ